MHASGHVIEQTVTPAASRQGQHQKLHGESKQPKFHDRSNATPPDSIHVLTWQIKHLIISFSHQQQTMINVGEVPQLGRDFETTVVDSSY